MSVSKTVIDASDYIQFIHVFQTRTSDNMLVSCRVYGVREMKDLKDIQKSVMKGNLPLE